ncbi:YjcZ family sporulation protein [Bacillus carboniphilus]
MKVVCILGNSGNGMGFVLLVVLFILLIIVGSSYGNGGY